jgi:hypothetical protein
MRKRLTIRLDPVRTGLVITATQLSQQAELSTEASVATLGLKNVTRT